VFLNAEDQPIRSVPREHGSRTSPAVGSRTWKSPVPQSAMPSNAGGVTWGYRAPSYPRKQVRVLAACWLAPASRSRWIRSARRTRGMRTAGPDRTRARRPPVRHLRGRHRSGARTCSGVSAGPAAARHPRAAVADHVLFHRAWFRPDVAEMTGAGREWTVSMISELSIPWR
jgi:hypothetical protein